MTGIESIEFEEGVFNEIYHEISEAYDNEDVRFIFIYGGSSSSKSYSEVQKTITYMMEGTENNSLIFRKFSTDIDNSIFQDFKTIISDWGLNDYFKIQKHYIECRLTGSFNVCK